MTALRRWLSSPLYRLAAWTAPRLSDPVPRSAEEAAQLMVADAYLVIGHLAYALDGPADRPSDAEIERALDYFSGGEFRDDFLPWPGEKAT